MFFYIYPNTIRYTYYIRIIADIRVIINEISLNFRTNQDDYIFANLSQYNANTAISAFYIARHQLLKLGIAWNLLTNGTRELITLRPPCPAPTFVI